MGNMAEGPTPILRAANRERFELELEFVQCLSNPLYLHELATGNYFDDPAFLNYLEYLRYWKEPPYAAYVLYPTSLKMLDLLSEKPFRERMRDPAHVDALNHQLISHWGTWREMGRSEI